MIYSVLIANMVLAVYAREALALAHARTITGAVVVAHEVLSALPEAVTEDLFTEQWDEEADTPVEIPRSITREKLERLRAETDKNKK